MKKQEEEFRDIPGFEGYQVSKLGRVKSLKTGKEKILKPSINRKNGYNQVGLVIYNKRYTRKIHTLVAITFLNHFTDGTNRLVIDHINNIKTDNRPENLQIISNRENCSKDINDSTSKYIGVCWNKQSNKWKAQIDVNGINKHLGNFYTEEEAAESYKKALNSIKNNEEIIIKKRVFSSTYKGVSFNKKYKKFSASIYINSKSKYLGMFTSEIEAHNAYQNKLSEINSKLN